MKITLKCGPPVFSFAAGLQGKVQRRKLWPALATRGKRAHYSISLTGKNSEGGLFAARPVDGRPGPGCVHGHGSLQSHEA